MQDSTLPSAPNKLISSAVGQQNRIHFTRSILTITVNYIFVCRTLCGIHVGLAEGPGALWRNDSPPHPSYMMSY